MNKWQLESARVISVISQKGGVGKTTSAVNLSAAFSLSGHNVLIVGTDPQCGVSRSLGFGHDQLHGGLKDLLSLGLDFSDIKHKASLENLTMVAPDAHTMDEESNYKYLMEMSIDTFVDAINEARSIYDTIIIDCPPGFGAETKAALSASDSYLVPVQAEELCRDSLTRLLSFVDELREQRDRPLTLEGLFMTMTDNRTLMSQHVATRLDEDFGDDLLRTSIPRTTRLTEMALTGKPAVIHDRRSAGSRAYFNLVDEIVERYSNRDIEAEKVAVENMRAAQSGGSDILAAMKSESTVPNIGGLSKLMQELSGNNLEISEEEEEDWSEDEPDMVSLDDLLEEEESGAGSQDENEWGYGEDYYDTIN
jgi:chromosome partitioning protein